MKETDQLANSAEEVEGMARWRVGEIRITRLLELPPAAFPPEMFLPIGRDDILRHAEWLVPDFATPSGDIVLHFQAFVVEAAGRRILVDPCIGNDKPRSHPALDHLETNFLDRLAAAGFPRQSIDVVLCTHLHVDHCGWNTMLVDGAWVPTFPNARYLFAADEIAYLRADTREPDAKAIYADSVLPIIAAGLADFVEPFHMVVEGVQLRPTPGHTPSHCSVFIESNGHQAILTGDVLHHPIQVALPELSSNFCNDPAVATRTRRGVLAEAADQDALMIPAHFSGPTAVRVAEDGAAWRIEPAGTPIARVVERRKS